ncbi:hypothetical protein HY405_01125 [Candidatus Microgenomates bacterium]|nr:hypothetical protein [Candidatus Microgenomates bacterium]
MTSEAIVKPANVEEETLSLVSAMRGDNLMVRRLSDIDNRRYLALVLFREIIRDRYGLRDEQILDLSDQKLETLFMILLKEAQKSFKYRYLLLPVTLGFIRLSSKFRLCMLVRSLRMLGGSPITGLDIRQNIEGFRLFDQGLVRKRSPSEREDLVQRRKP